MGAFLEGFFTNSLIPLEAVRAVLLILVDAVCAVLLILFDAVLLILVDAVCAALRRASCYLDRTTAAIGWPPSAPMASTAVTPKATTTSSFRSPSTASPGPATRFA